MRKQRIPNIAVVANFTAIMEKPKKGQERDVVKRMLQIGLGRKVPPWLFQKILNEIKSYDVDTGIMVSYYLIEHVRYRWVHHSSDKETEKKLQTVYKIYDDYRAEKRKAKLNKDLKT